MRHVCFGQPLVDFEGLVRCDRFAMLTADRQRLRTPEESLVEGASRLAAGVAARLSSRVLAAAAVPIIPKARAAACTTSGPCSLQELGERFHGLGVASHADAADDADQQPALELAQGASAGPRPRPGPGFGSRP